MLIKKNFKSLIFILQNYLEQAIENEKSLIINNGKDRNTLKNLERMVQEYEQIKKILEDNKGANSISCDEVFRIIDRLYKLKHYGDKIKEMKDKQQRVRDIESSMVARERSYNPADRSMKDYTEVPRAKARTNSVPVKTEQNDTFQQANVRMNQSIRIANLMKQFENINK